MFVVEHEWLSLFFAQVNADTAKHLHKTLCMTWAIDLVLDDRSPVHADHGLIGRLVCARIRVTEEPADCLSRGVRRQKEAQDGLACVRPNTVVPPPDLTHIHRRHLGGGLLYGDAAVRDHRDPVQRSPTGRIGERTLSKSNDTQQHRQPCSPSYPFDHGWALKVRSVEDPTAALRW